VAEPDETDQLYGLPLGDFTPARNELAARLRRQGDRAAGDAAKALAKPSVTAWALNQVARRQPALVEGLLAAGEALTQAQQRLLAGRGQDRFWEAGKVQKQAVAKLVQAAAAVLADAERAPSKPLLDRLAATAQAAAADVAGGQLLRAGRLAADLDPTGFGELGGFGLPAAPIPFPRERSRATVRQAAPMDERRQPRPGQAHDHAGPVAPENDQRLDRLSHAREDVRRLQHELQALQQQAGEAEGSAARARQAASKAARAWAEAREAAARAENAFAEAGRAEEDAAESLAAIRAQLHQTGEDLKQAEAALRRLRS